MAGSFEHRLEHIIRTARRRTGNINYSATMGVPQRDFVQFANDAQERIYNKMLQVHSTLFQKQVLLGTTFGVAAVPLPTSDIYLDHNVISVLFSYNGNPINYAPLELRSVRQEISVNGYPSSYFIMGDNIILSPIPSNTVSGALKVTYQKVVPTLDIRRAFIASATTNSLQLDNTTLPSILDESVSDLNSQLVDYVSVVDKDGNTLASTVPVNYSGTPYSTTTQILTLATGALTAAQVSAINAASSTVGAFLLFGTNATTHAQIPKVCERFITEYVVLRAQMGDSNKESADTSPLLLAIEQEIIDSLEELEEDLSAIPVLDYSMLNYADELG